jgi:hypothetical protein
MWFMEMLAVNLTLLAAAAAALLLAAGCEWGVAGWLWATARGLTLALVFVVLGTALALILALLRVL